MPNFDFVAAQADIHAEKMAEEDAKWCAIDDKAREYYDTIPEWAQCDEVWDLAWERATKEIESSWQ